MGPGPWARSDRVPVASAPPIRPEASRRPAMRISATASMIPEPQMPVTPVFFRGLGKARIGGPQVRCPR